MKRILISGATGYVGSNLARKLNSLGYEVHIIIRKASNLDKIKDIEENIKKHIFSGSTDDLCEIVLNINPDIVIHLASMFIGEHKIQQVKQLVDSNVLFSTQLMEASVNAGVKYFVNTGTQWQHYQDKEYSPVNLYAATKEAFESIAKYYVESFDMRMITLKLSDTYGPMDTRLKIINKLFEIAQSEEVLDMSKGEQEIGLLYIDDVINAFLIAIEKIQKMNPHECKEFLVLPDKIYSLKEVVNVFEDIINKKLKINWGKREYRKREMMKIYTKEENILKESEIISLYEGISNFIKQQDI
ncbi:NAD(P)-dependent oxidoreductase [Romboutsia maritimum]|uniref:NAD(P)-dependent oxidoreductase n=1 Tax=Romboutsia maritimum TaxID=2020948 RepID=A0A371IVK0_9FIRM|nr:NAD(P)-dependent oxidoreductase [Romboutsia maritimum]RDY24514.1 NAD(P)-dependent oxidoreductase [Romboutsia maritimum]